MTQRQLSSEDVLALLESEEAEEEDDDEILMEGSDEEFSGCDSDLEEETGK